MFMIDASVARLDASRVEPRGSGIRARLHRHLLVLRFALFNVVAFGLLAATWLQGWLEGALVGDTFWLSAVICAVFLYGLAQCTSRVVSVNRELNRVRAAAPAPGSRAEEYLNAIAGRASESRAVHTELLRLRLSHAIAIVRHVANTLVLLGLVGTVIGFIVALSGVKPELTVNVENVAPMVSTLINGMSIALFTTLIGAVLHVWLMIGYRMLASASVQLYDAIVDLGERRVGR
jgi:hypothetical protein